MLYDKEEKFHIGQLVRTYRSGYWRIVKPMDPAHANGWYTPGRYFYVQREYTDSLKPRTSELRLEPIYCSAIKYINKEIQDSEVKLVALRTILLDELERTHGSAQTSTTQE